MRKLDPIYIDEMDGWMLYELSLNIDKNVFFLKEMISTLIQNTHSRYTQ